MSITITQDPITGDEIVTLCDGIQIITDAISGEVTIMGTEDDDIIFGSNGDEIINSGGGDDTIFARGGDDIIDAGEGNDVVFAGSGNDIVDGGTGNDRIYGNSGMDIISGGDGDDFISGGKGNDILDGGSGSDFILGGKGDDRVIYRFADHSNATNTLDKYNGGGSRNNLGNDTLELKFTQQELNDLGLTGQDIETFFNQVNASNQYVDFRDLHEDLDLIAKKFETIDVVVEGGGQAIGPITDSNNNVNEVLENSIAGTLVGITAFAQDPDVADTVTYSLTDNAGGLFAVDANSGIVTVAGLIDREAAASHDITVRADSTDGSFSEETFTINILDQDDVLGSASNCGF